MTGFFLKRSALRRRLIFVGVFGLFFSGITITAHAQGDFAPYQSNKQMKQILNSRQAAVRRADREAAIKRWLKFMQIAYVKHDGAAIYSAPNFDAPVLGYMDKGRKIWVSKKMYTGVGGLGYFYRLPLKPHGAGFITDTDIILPDQKNSHNHNDSFFGSSSNSESEDDNNIDLYMNRYVGLSYYNLNFSEKISGGARSASTPMYGLKYVGPTSLMGGMPLDFDLMFTTTPPSFYNQIATSTSGFMAIGDMIANLPITQTSRILVTAGFGLLARFSKWSVLLRQSPGLGKFDSEELTMGVVGELSATIRLKGRFALRGDARYIYEKEQYAGIGAALEYQY